jgi:hypothetical protein
MTSCHNNIYIRVFTECKKSQIVWQKSNISLVDPKYQFCYNSGIESKKELPNMDSMKCWTRKYTRLGYTLRDGVWYYDSECRYRVYYTGP